MLRPPVSARPVISRSSHHATSSTLYTLDPGTITLRPVDHLPKRIAIKQVAVSCTHTMILSYDNELFTWGSNDHGQLGLGDTSDRVTPQKVESLRGRNIHSVGVGSGFSVICCDRGTILACGDARLTGLGGQQDITRPTLLDDLLRFESISLMPRELCVMPISQEHPPAIIFHEWHRGTGATTAAVRNINSTLGMAPLPTDRASFCEPNEPAPAVAGFEGKSQSHPSSGRLRMLPLGILRRDSDVPNRQSSAASKLSATAIADSMDDRLDR
ncbi:unnamed protein product [Heligmosomoides polygyrus]|uniref:Ig-like domain-containing protein n=1 Tax=Heligmosomoides polygyrus TaxID=6339 RepID=A0A183GM86_HELPZ|nr:unnamed protein product [Heligmosomoides polygyrus]